jgi:type VI secretion system secreted protein Hcp
VAVDLFLVIPQNPATPQINPTLTTTTDQYFSTAFPNAAVFEVADYDFVVENPTTIGAGGGAGAGKVRFDGLVIHKQVDKISPVLFTISASGEHFAVVQLYVRRTGGAPGATPYLAYEFQTVFITNIEWSASDSADPTEAVTFAYGVVVIAFEPTNADGSPAAAVVRGSWSEITNEGNIPDTLNLK